jgi:hypothetical protein
MSKEFPQELQANIKTVRIMAIILAVCGFITILGIPWALLFILLAVKPTNVKLLKFTAVATIPICWCIVPIFLEIGLWRLIKKLETYQAKGAKALKSNREWNKLHFLRRYSPATDMVAVLIILIVLILPVPHTASKVVDIPYATQSIQDSSIELGDSQTRQPGTNGQGLERQRIVQPLFAYVLGIHADYSTDDLPTQTTQAPTNQITAQGTKKYQYMWCSDGSYRYYTNDQFGSPTVGFTHKSPDDCAKNGDGHMTGLADTAPPQQTTRTIYEPSYITTPTYTTCNEGFGYSISCTTY